MRWIVAACVALVTGCGSPGPSSTPDTSEPSTDTTEDGNETDTEDVGVDVADTDLSDTARPDADPADTSLPDTALTDTVVADTDPIDTSADTADTQRPDTGPEDTGPDAAPWGTRRCWTQWPPQTAAVTGQPTPTLYLQVDAESSDPTGWEAEVGIGTGPDPSRWRWTAAGHNASCSSCDGTLEFAGFVTPSTRGYHRWAGRVRYGDEPWSYCDGAHATDWQADRCPGVFAQTADGAVVETLNLRCLLDDWPARYERILDGWVARAPDAIAVQEVCAEPGGDDNLQALAEGLSERTGLAFAFERANSHWSWDRYDEGVGLLSPIPLDDVRVLELPAGAFPRRAIAGTLLGEQDVRVVSTHLDHQDRAARDTQLAALNAWLATVEGPVILMGDFNQTPDSAFEATMGDAGFTDPWPQLHPDESGLTFPATAPRIRIDYAWWRADASPWSPLELQRTFLVGEDGPASDHLGLAARFGASAF